MQWMHYIWKQPYEAFFVWALLVIGAFFPCKSRIKPFPTSQFTHPAPFSAAFFSLSSLLLWLPGGILPSALSSFIVMALTPKRCFFFVLLVQEGVFVVVPKTAWDCHRESKHCNKLLIAAWNDKEKKNFSLCQKSLQCFKTAPCFCYVIRCNLRTLCKYEQVWPVCCAFRLAVNQLIGCVIDWKTARTFSCNG